jgi:adenylate cyclase
MLKIRMTKHLNITLKEQRYFRATVIGLAFGAFTHMNLIVLFFLLNAKILFYYNFFSVALFIALILSLLTSNEDRQSLYHASIYIVGIELIIHQVLCVILIGWNAGFQYFLIPFAIIPYLAPPGKKVLKISASTVGILSYLFLDLVFKTHIPYYLVSGQIIKGIDFFCTFSGLFIITIMCYYFSSSVANAEIAFEKEHQRAEKLLHNILPAPIAKRLEDQPETIADGFECVTVFFADIVGFSKMSEATPPHEMVSLLNEIFTKLDELAQKYGIEKIKTIGDAYMAAAGIPLPVPNHAQRIIDFSIDVINYIIEQNNVMGRNISIRIGISSGPAVAGVIGRNKFIYDLWGNTVNTSARMESSGIPGKIQVSESTYELLKDTYSFENRGKVDIKGKGLITTYLLKTQSLQKIL